VAYSMEAAKQEADELENERRRRRNAEALREQEIRDRDKKREGSERRREWVPMEATTREAAERPNKMEYDSREATLERRNQTAYSLEAAKQEADELENERRRRRNAEALREHEIRDMERKREGSQSRMGVRDEEEDDHEAPRPDYRLPRSLPRSPAMFNLAVTGRAREIWITQSGREGPRPPNVPAPASETNPSAAREDVEQEGGVERLESSTQRQEQEQEQNRRRGHGQ
jgi:hypothetical protein